MVRIFADLSIIAFRLPQLLYFCPKNQKKGNAKMNEIKSAESFMLAVNAMKQSLDIPMANKDVDLEIAVSFNLKRKYSMIQSVQELYAYLHGNGPKPTMMPSEAFCPVGSQEAINIHYFFKYMANTPPWDLHKELLVLPVAATMLLIDIMTELFNDVVIYRYRMLVMGFIDRWARPKLRAQWTDKELENEIIQYNADMKKFEEQFRLMYGELSSFFLWLEKPETNPVRKEISETHKHARKIAKKILGEEPKASYIAQEEAYRIWTEYKNSPEVKTKYCNKDHRVTYADIFDYCQKQLYRLGFRTAEKFEKAILSVKKRKSRVGNATR